LRLLLVAIFLLLPLGSYSYAKSESSSSNSVSGYTKKDGTYVAPHQRTNPNQTQRDNWSSKPNTNPYTGKDGTKEPRK
jgi:hypothetical protein